MLGVDLGGGDDTSDFDPTKGGLGWICSWESLTVRFWREVTTGSVAMIRRFARAVEDDLSRDSGDGCRGLLIRGVFKERLEALIAW